MTRLPRESAGSPGEMAPLHRIETSPPEGGAARQEGMARSQPGLRLRLGTVRMRLRPWEDHQPRLWQLARTCSSGAGAVSRRQRCPGGGARTETARNQGLRV